MRPEPDIAGLRRCVRLCPETGHLFWLERDPDTFDNPRFAAGWNTHYAGKRAFACVSPSDGYLVGAINSRQLKAHRVTWALHFGKWPAEFLDHINGIRTDNRISNLREVSYQGNARNACRDSRNNTGVAGVSWNKRQKVYRAFIMGDGRRIYLGRFATLAEAASARKQAEIELGYHPNHGREPTGLSLGETAELMAGQGAPTAPGLVHHFARACNMVETPPARRAA